MAMFAVSVTFVLVNDDDTANPINDLHEILNEHKVLANSFAINGEASIVPEGEWTAADSYNARRSGWDILPDSSESECVASVNTESSDLSAQRYVIRRAMIDNDPFCVRALRHMRENCPENFRAMVLRSLHQG